MSIVFDKIPTNLTYSIGDYILIDDEGFDKEELFLVAGYYRTNHQTFLERISGFRKDVKARPLIAVNADKCTFVDSHYVEHFEVVHFKLTSNWFQKRK